MNQHYNLSLIGGLAMAGILSFFPACKPFSQSSSNSVFPQQLEAPTPPEILTQPLAIQFSDINDSLASPADVQAFYIAGQNKSVWVNSSGILPAADSMVKVIRSADKYALHPGEYGLHKLEALLESPLSNTQLQQLELTLTDAFITMGRHLRDGRLQSKNVWKAPAPLQSDSSLVVLLANALKENNVRQALESLEPLNKEYLALKAELANLLSSPLTGKTQREQQQYTNQLASLKINMDRWRWESGHFPDHYILINIPSYKLQVFEGTKVVLESKVIVGAEANPTPVLQSFISSFVVYPYWNVPRSIAINELLPLIKADSTYLRRHFYQVLDARGNVLDSQKIDWTTVSSSDFPYYLRQAEGESNALGIIKFNFSNPYSVYLHDTNAKGLFGQKMRALSHGCIRLEKAKELAAYLVRNDANFSDPDLLKEYFARRIRTEIILTEPVPLYVRYFTAGLEKDEVVYYPDVYGKDRLLLPFFNF